MPAQHPTEPGTGGRPEGRIGRITRLVRYGFSDTEAANALLDRPELAGVRTDPNLLHAIGVSADPDLALHTLSRLVEALDRSAPARRHALLDALSTAKPLRDRLFAVLGSSAALGDHLVRHPDDWHALHTPEDTATRPGPEEFGHVLADAVRAAAPERDEPATPGLDSRGAADALRVGYRRCLLTVAARDLCGTADVTRVAAELADLASATLRAALTIAERENPHDAAACRLAVIGLGKCGGLELNYVSDVDVVFVAERPETPHPLSADAAAPDDVDESHAVRAATRLAARMMRLCSDTTAEGSIWPVDANLRPEGRNGPLVRTLASYQSYYQRWAKTWEFQALLKARPVAGDRELGQRYLHLIDPLVWHVSERDNFVSDVQAMRRRVEQTIPRTELDRELKLAPGGLRDVEFAVQLLQLVHGRSDPSLRSGTTLTALTDLATGGYVGRADAAALDEAYRFLRILEHRIQLFRLRRTHLLPVDDAELRRLARGLGMRGAPVTELLDERRRHAREVRRLHEKLFYRPLLDAVARLRPGAPLVTEDGRIGPAGASRRATRRQSEQPGGAPPEAEVPPAGQSSAEESPEEERAAEEPAGLSLPAARERLASLGYADPAAALRHMSALASGVSRKAAIQRTLLPVMLGWFADSADPDAGLLTFRRVSDALGSTPWYLRLLRDEGAAAQSLARVLSSGRFAPDLLLRAPEAVGMLGQQDGLLPRRQAMLDTEIGAAVDRAEGPEQAVRAVRGVRRRELFRIAAADVLELLGTGGGQAEADESGQDAPGPSEELAARAQREGFSAVYGPAVDAAGDALSEVTSATLAGALRAAETAVRRRHGTSLPTRLAVIGMGRFGGHELSYGSDADVLFVHEPLPGTDETEAARAAHAVANELRRLLELPAGDPPLPIDADLRPEGRQGPLVRTLAAYRVYYERWSAVWESQALLRAAPVAGDVDLGRRFVELIDPMRYPEGGLGPADVREIRRIKARVESERLPRGVDPAMHTKLGRGGLADVEWTVQLLQLTHAYRVPELRTTGTRAALVAARGADLLDPDDARVLDDAWVEASRVRNAVMLVRGRPGDTFPADTRELDAVARMLGYGSGNASLAIEEYRRVTRRARAVLDRVFYG